MGNDLSQVFLLEFQNAYKEDISINTRSVWACRGIRLLLVRGWKERGEGAAYGGVL